MDFSARIEAALEGALSRAISRLTPPRLQQAIRWAVFPDGARLRPRLLLAVVRANGDPDPELADAAAAAVELIHCASLVHDDLPCFDDADERRGKPSVHRAFGEPLAVLVGDGLIVTAFETLTAAEHDPGTALRLVHTLARAVGLGGGIIAGQAWESEPVLPLPEYRRAKTGALFEAAAAMGALATGTPSESWGRVGVLLGEAYQVADDLADLAGSRARLGKPVGRDAALGRGNEALSSGIDGALNRFRSLVSELHTAVPPCRGRAELQAFMSAAAARLLPAQVGRLVA